MLAQRITHKMQQCNCKVRSISWWWRWLLWGGKKKGRGNKWEEEKGNKETFPTGQLEREVTEHPLWVSSAFPVVILWFSHGPAYTPCCLFQFMTVFMLHQGRCWMLTASWGLYMHVAGLSNVYQKLLPRGEDRGEKDYGMVQIQLSNWVSTLSAFLGARPWE